MKLGCETPIDAVAARVTSRGEHFEYQVHPSVQDSDVPLLMRAPTRAQIMSPTFEDLSDRRLGRLRVLGISADRKARWVCKCLCGKYTLRTAAAIKAAADDAACSQCYLLAVAKRNDVKRRTGRDVHTKNILSQ